MGIPRHPDKILETVSEVSRKVADIAHEKASAEAVQKFEETSQQVFEAENGEEIFEAIRDSAPDAIEAVADGIGDAADGLAQLAETVLAILGFG